MFRWVVVFSFFTALPLFSAPFPEDGSLKINGWVHSAVKNQLTKKVVYPAINNYAALKRIAAHEGFKLSTVEILGVGEQWFQDYLLFNQSKKLIQMADLDWQVLEAYPPTLSTYYTLDDRDLYRASWIQWIGKKLDFSIKKLKVSRMEGGEMITGMRGKKTYVLVKHDVIQRTKMQLNLKDETKAVEAVAKDLGVDSKNLFMIKGEELPPHIDTFIMPLPNGKLLVNSSYPKVVEYLLDQGFKIRKIKGSKQSPKRRTTNYFNSVVAKSPKDGKVFVMTNGSGNKIADALWMRFLKKLGVERVYFVGTFQPDAGIGCAGAIY